MAGQIRWSGTFIEAREVEPARRRRATSAPHATRDEGGEDIFGAARQYVEGLNDRLQPVWRERVAPAAYLAGEGPSAAPAFCPDAGKTEGSERSAETSSGGDAASSPTSEGQAEVMPWVWNEGSYGHPELCSRPCLYYASGRCANGSDCEFCHLPHVFRQAQLGKKRRATLQDMPAWKAKAFIFPILREKVLAFDSSFETRSAFEHLLRAGRMNPKAAVPEATRNDRAMACALRGTSLRLLFASLQRSVLHERERAARAAAEALEERLRRVAMAAAHP